MQNVCQWLIYQATKYPSPANARRNRSVLVKLEHMANVIFKQISRNGVQFLVEMTIY